ncbi:MAG: alpha/beta fold hydrolase [Solirubrobacteraceae bacterium]
MVEHRIERAEVSLAVEEAGAGAAVVLLHGLTATRRYVVMGSRALERSGHRVIAYDARGHGRSSAAADSAAYTYPDLVGDLEAVLHGCGVRRAVLVGASMGAHTALALALAHPERVAGLVVITPAHTDGAQADAERLARWDALAEGLRRGGVEGFLAAYGDPGVSPQWRQTVIEVIRQRLAQHQHLEAVAAALRAVPRSAPFASVAELESIAAPVAVVGSSDAADPGHPSAVAQVYADTIPGAWLVADEPGASPTAWRGSALSKVIAEVVEQAGLR